MIGLNDRFNKDVKPQQNGLTLIELMTGLAVAVILAAIAIPSYTDFIERGRLKALTEAVYSDLQFAYSESLKGEQTSTSGIAVTFDITNQCYGLELDQTVCDCNTANDCSVKEVDATTFPGVTISANSFDSNRTRFNSIRGTADAGSVTLTSTTDNNLQLRVNLNLLGRVSVCAPNDNVVGYEGC